MSLLDAKCPNCGQILKVDDAKEAAICEFCGSAFIVEKAINNYNITGSVTIGEGAVIYNSESKEKLLENGETALRIKNYDLALETYERCTKSYPEEYKGWWGYIRAHTLDFTAVKEVRTDVIQKCYSYILTLCTESEEITKMEDIYKGYLYRLAQADVDQVKQSVQEKIASKEEQLVGKPFTYKNELNRNTADLNRYLADKQYKSTKLIAAAILAGIGLLSIIIGCAVGVTGSVVSGILFGILLIAAAIYCLYRSGDVKSFSALNEQIARLNGEVAELNEKIAQTQGEIQELQRLLQTNLDTFSRFLYIEYCGKYLLDPGLTIREYNMIKQILTANEIEYVLR